MKKIKNLLKTNSINSSEYFYSKDPRSIMPDGSLFPTDEELKSWIELSVFPPDLKQVAAEVLKEINDELDGLEECIRKNTIPSSEQLMKWFDSRLKSHSKRFALADFLVKNKDKLKQILESFSNPQTFALPSHVLMLSLLAMFAGKPKRIPRRLLEKPNSKRTSQEQEQVTKYLNDIFQIEKEVDYSDGFEVFTEKRFVLICDNPKVKAKAEIKENELGNLYQDEESLAIFIQRVFGPEGIRHLLGMIVGLEENFRKGRFEWSANEHLERLGYTKWPNGSFDPNLKRMASAFIKIITGLCFTTKRKDGKSGSIQADRLFMIERFKLETFDKDIIDEKITLVATEFWYQNAFVSEDEQGPQYTKLLKEIVKESHKEHPLTLYLAPLLAIFWRINILGETKFKVKTLLEWCNLKTEGKHRSDDLRDLESTIEYMKIKSYLGNWINSGESKFPSECANPYDCVLTFIAPDWLKQEFMPMQKKQSMPTHTQQQDILTTQDFITIFKESNLSQGAFAKETSLPRPLVTMIINGKRAITQETSNKVKAFVFKQQKQQVNYKN